MRGGDRRRTRNSCSSQGQGKTSPHTALTRPGRLGGLYRQEPESRPVSVVRPEFGFDSQEFGSRHVGRGRAGQLHPLGVFTQPDHLFPLPANWLVLDQSARRTVVVNLESWLSR